MASVTAPLDQMDPDDPVATDRALKQSAALAAWRKRSALIQRLRRWLPLAMGAIVALLLMWVAVRAVLTAISASGASVGSVHMTNVRFHGRDSHDRSFVINAHDAIRDGVDNNRIQLVSPDFVLAGDGGQPAHRMTGRQGVFQSDKKMLYMSGHVVLDDGKGSRFISDRATLNIGDGTVQGDSSVKGDSPLGHIEASSYSVDGHGDHVVFVGNVRGHLVTQPEHAPQAQGQQEQGR